MSENKNDWRSRVKAMMTDPKYAEKMASVVDNTRKVNTDLMNKSEEYESSLSLDKPKQEPLDLARVDEMKAEDAARATMPSDDDNYSGVSDLATKLYAEERNRRIGKAEQRSNAFSNAYVGSPQSMRFSQAMMDIRDVEKAKNVQGIYDKVLQDESVAQAIRINADKALSKAMEQNQSMNEDEQKKVYDESVNKQLEAIGKGIDKYLYDINAPKSEAEWIAKNAVNSSIMGQMLTSPMNVEGGENAYRQQALADYGAKASWLSQGISMAGSLIIDTLPMMGIGTAFAAPASKAAMWGVGKVGGKALQGSLIGRGVVGSVGGAATLGGYNAASALTTQFSNGQFDLGEITSSAGHGALMGGLTGIMSPMLRGVSQGMGKVGKAATMAGGLGAEAGIFSAAELAEMENPYDFETIAKTFGKNVVVIGGLKLSNPIKTISEYKRWYNEGKQSNFNDADYKMMADFAKAKGFANNEAFSMSADGVYSRSIADRVTGNRTLLELTKLEGGKERNLAIEMYNDPNVPISLKTKIAAKMNLPAPKPLLANGVRVEGNKAITYCTMPNGTQQVIEIKEFARPRNARAFANEFSRTTARKNDLMQTEAAVNNISTEPIVAARLNEQAKRNGTTYDEELARLNDIVQRAAEGTITPEDIAYYSSIVDTDISATEAIKQGIKDEYGVEIDDVLKSDGNLTDAQDKAMTAYADALRGIVEQGNPTTERMLVASTSGVADYVALNRLGIEQTRQIMENPAQRAEIDAQMRSKYGAWLKYFDGKMGEDALAAKLGYDLNNSTDLQNFLAEQTYFKNKAADRIAANTTDVAKQLLEQGGRGVRFTEGGKVKLQGVPYPIEVSQEIVDRYDAAMQGSGEPMSRIVNDALKDIIKQSETPSAPKEPIMEQAPDATEQPMTDADAVTQQMVDARMAEIDTDLQGIEADGVQRMTIDGRPVAIIKGRIVADADGKVDKAKSSTEVAYMLLDENGRPILEDGKPKIEVGVKPSNVRVEDIEQWRSVDDYKAAEEQRIRDNNRLTDEAMRMADEEMRTEEMPAESKAEEITDPQTTDELLTLCKGNRELALDVAMDELNRAQQSKGKGANAAETMAINWRIRTYQRMVDDLSKVEEPTPTEAPTEQNADAQVTDDMEFIYQKDLGENHDGMEPMQLADGRYKWVGLQRGELTATMGERDTELLDGLAKKLGVAVIPINVADRAVNGYYRDGNIYVNTNRGAEWTMRWVAGHEMLHDVAKKSPEAYDAYKQAVLNMWDASYIDNQVKQIIDDYAASGKTIDREQALTELVNDFGGELFNSRDGLKILDSILKDQSKRGNVGFVDTIKQWWEKLKEFFGVTPYASEVEKKLADAYKEAIANAEKFGKNYDFDYSIIGKRGAENLDKVEEATIRLDNLAVAREMESSGKDAKTIRMATGWERGADNKWRYEIPDELDLTDGEMILNIAIDKAKWKRAAEKLGTTAESLKSENDNLKAEVERRRMISTIEQMLADNESTNDLYVRELKKSTLLKKLNFYKTGLKYKDSDDVEKMWADLKDSIDKVDVLKLSEVMGADNAIFKAYPELADIDVRFDAKGNTSVLATVSNDGKEIWVNPHNIESQSSVFLHEIQHLIQKIEGFARGGSSRMFDIPEEHKFANMPGSVIKSMREQAEFARKKLSEFSTIEEIREYYKANRSWLTSSEKDAVISVMDALMYGESVEDAVSSLEKDYQQAIDDLNWSLTSKDSPYSKYTRLGGEVESRNVQNRMNMSEEERRNTLLSETEDVAREDQLFLPNDLNESSKGDYSIKQPKDAEYEAKEQWRKENAGAITSSFFAERRLDKADKIQKLKDEINKLIKETRATNKENSEKVKEIAKEMQAYIKENIPTETQGDMTRTQFEQVIKQLATAITRKDLEKPMRMVEYIGANANRRALTRQMRDFLKQGFKGMTPKGLVKAKNVDGATSRVLGLAKSLYESMGKQPLGSDLRALQTKVRGIKAELEDLNNANGGAFSEYVEQINAILKKSGVDRYEEMTKYYNELSDRQDVGEIQVSEVLDHINRMLPELFSIELVKEQHTQAKADSAMTTKEDLEQLKNNLENKREKGILSKEDQAVLDNMAMYELMVDLQQRQLDIDGPGTSSIASQMAAKVREAKQYRDELEKYDDKQSGVAKNLKDNIKRVNAEMEELFVQRTQAQKEVNANVAELLDNLKQLRDTGNSALKEWSKNKQERETRIVNMANASFGKDARGYWSEVDRRGGWKRDFSNRINNLKLAALMSPALSFEYMVGVMDPRYYTNESPIYKQFIKGEDGLIKANDNFFEGLESFNNGINEAVERFINRNAMQSLKEYFNKGDRFATEIIPFEFEVKENVNGEVVTSIVHRDAEMTRGRAAKIYAWSRMADGMAKLKAHGVTDETMEVVKAFIGQDYMDFIDWVEDEYFPKLRREKYNPIYKKMYGISMAENEHYFPFETYKKDIRTEKELEQINSDNLGGGIVGNIIERKRNNARLDFTDESPDIFDAISEYGRKMEEWAAYAQVREDLKKVINNKQFKQHCDMLGTNYYNHFLDAARVASRLYNPQPSAPQLQNAAAKLQKVFASAAISLRVSTALKQLLSAPAFAVYSLDPAFHKELLKTASAIDVESAIKGLRELANGNKAEAKRLLLEENWVGHYNWCVNNLPSFRERVSKGGAGNPILEEKGWSKFSDDVQSVGMLPNRLVDAFTCSVGAKAIYEYAFNKYKKTYDEVTAHNMAVTDAEIAFNSSQQSSNPVFLSPLQSSKEFWLRGIMNYKNSPIGYYRNGMKANIDLYRATKVLFGKPKFTINGEQVGFESNGTNPAAKAAEAAAKSIMFNFFLNYLWAFGTIGIAGISYTMMNNDNDDGNMLYTDEEFDKATGGNMALAVFNAANQGVPWISGFASVSQTGQDYTPSILFSEMNNYLEQVNKEGFMSLATAQLLIDLGLKNAIGVDPEVWGQIYRGAQGIMADRPMRTEDFMNLLASPRSAIAGVAKQKVGEYNNMQDYVNARIESEREIGINETMDLGKKLMGLRPLRKSKLDGYIDEYLADKIPDYRELANKPDEKAKEERMEESNAFKNLHTLVSTVQHTEEKKKSSKKIDGNEETKDKVKKIRKAVNVIHKLYASGDASSAQRIADELERRLKRGYNENGATLDDKLKNVDIYDSTGTTEQRGNDGFDTMFDRAMLGGFDGVYLGSKLD